MKKARLRLILNLTRLFGESDGSVRTPKQTEIALFWTDEKNGGSGLGEMTHDSTD